ncbi:MAG: hypothetical protein CSA24_00500 [Deltaproteobacteria bacterium]|nr:MAG: hypothetical protein CSB49_00580 [Pseudomonadota bacterium]PIE66320.1 MAG: hypothetical protein CSA24_00500 [Deltaproteobacteria bacterium]
MKRASFGGALASVILAIGACGGSVANGGAGDSDGVHLDGGGSTYGDTGFSPSDLMRDDSGKPQHSWPTCASATGEAKLTSGGVDIIWFVDTSGSMGQETAWVQQNLNDFASYIGSQNLDYRVILIGASSICVTPPLGGKSCTDGPRYRHVKEVVGSKNGLSKIISTYPKWRDFLRADTTKNFVAVTDDNSRKSAAWFNTEIAKLKQPGFPDGFIFHSIVAYGSVPKKGCSTGARIGQVYLDLTAQTSGVKFPVCNSDWKSIFDKLAKSVAQTAKAPCSYLIPDPPAGKTFNPNLVLVWRADPGQERVIPQVANKAACGQSGWYYDDEANPKNVILCPETCKAVEGGKIEIEFGCTSGID